MKKIILMICLLTVLLLAFAGCAAEGELYEVTYYSSEENQSQYVLENGQLRLTVDGKTSYFTLEDLSSGRIWRSVPEGGTESADKSTRNLMQSTFVLTYTDKSGNSVPYDSFTYAIEGGTFRIRQEKDTIFVDHMVGPAERVWQVPEVISVERMDALTANMSNEHRAAVLKGYRKLDPERLKPDTLAQYQEMVPLLKEQAVYVLATAIGGGALPNYQMEMLVEAFASVSYTKEDAEADRADRQKDASAIQYNLTLSYRLDGDALLVDVPAEKILYPAELPVEKVSVLPYFCAAGEEAEGYLLVPDGGGAQIDFNNGKLKQSSYYSNIYGWDEAFDREKLLQDPKAELPVFGIASNGGYLLAVADSGAGEMSVEADIGGKRSSYNYVRPEFKVVHGEDTTVSAKSNATIRVFQQDYPNTVFSLRYIAGNSDSYVTMAQRFREYLQSRYPNIEKIQETGIPLVTTLIGAIDISQKTLGMPTRTVVAAADYQEAVGILQQLSDVENLRIQYMGVLNDGMDQSALLKAKEVPRLGGAKARQAFLAAAKELDVDVYLGGYVQTVYSTPAFDGFGARADAIRDTTNTTVERYYFVPSLRMAFSDDLMYLLNGPAQERAIALLAKTARELGFTGTAYSDIGNLLYSDFHHDTPMSRQDMESLQQAALAKLEGEKLMVSGGNLYSAVYADCITGMDLLGGKYDLIDRYVPFYHIALHGYIPYTGDPLNASDNYRRSLLKSVEYGAGLQFRFFEFDYTQLRGSDYASFYNLYSGNFADWQQELTAVYGRLNEELGHTAALCITDHSWVTEKVAMTEYEDGTRVYVNYGNTDYQAGSVKISAQDWAVVKGA